MFQYAAARALSLEKNTALNRDRTWFDLEIEKQTPRHYGLDHFRLMADFVTEKERTFFLNPYTGSILNRITLKWNAMQPYYKQRVYKEPHFHFDAHFFNAKSTTYLIGYWQSEKYFSKYAQQIRDDFRFKEPLNTQNEMWRQQILSSNAVSLHVRRGDMVANPEVVKTHGSCGIDYYRAAAAKIAEGIDNPEFFVFSDEPNWCKENLNLEHPTHYIDNNTGDTAYCDMQLMSICRHHVIANSSFSWWGAWLNPRGDKKVIAPKRWFADDSKDTRDLIPKAWLRM
ncbi:MAG: alpha-1,2-fucosyltransferase [Bacteroidia bacterium]